MTRSSIPVTSYGFNLSSGWLMLWGIVLILLGIAAIGAQFTATLVSVIFLGAIIFIGGIVSIVDAFANWWRRWRGFWAHLLLGLLYAAVGLMVIKSPVMASVSLTLLLGIFYLVVGIYRLIFSSMIRLPRWGWSFFSGLVSALLGFLILISWPASSLFIIGLFVGIDLLFWGFSYVMAAFSLRARW